MSNEMVNPFNGIESPTPPSSLASRDQHPNPFNGIESYYSVYPVLAPENPDRIHSMELKALGG
jgi:hypothetical protein